MSASGNTKHFTNFFYHFIFFFRFDGDCIVVEYLLEDAVNKKRPSTDKGVDLCYMHPYVGALAFFSDCKIFIDNEYVKGPETGALHFHFQYLNRTFCSTEFRNEKFKYPIPRPRVDYEHENKKPADGTSKERPLTDKQRELYESLDAQSYKAAPNVTSCNFDCHWPLSSQSSCLQILERKKIDNPFLRPGVKIEIQLYRRENRVALIQKPLATIASQLDTANLETEKDPNLSKYSINIKNIKIIYESWTPVSPGPIREFKHYATTFFSDVPTIKLAHLQSGVTQVTHRILLQENSKVCFFSLVPSHNITYISQRNKPMTPFLTLPDSLKHIRFLMGGKPIASTDGFTYPSTLGYKDPGCRAYYNYLIQRKLYDSPLKYLFPSGETLSLDQSFFLDLTSHDTKNNPELEVDMIFNNPTPAQWDMLTVTLHQVKHTCKNVKENLWNWNFNELI